MAKHSYLIEDPAVLQSFLNDNIWKKRYYSDFMPLKYTPTINYRYKIAEKGAQVAAEIVSFGSKAPRKFRETGDVKYGQLPPIRVKRLMDEDDLLEYDTAMRQPQTPSREIMDWIFGDVGFVYDAIEAERDYLALQVLCNFTLDLTTTTNPNAPTQTQFTFGLPAAQKICVKSSATTRKWGTGTDTQIQPITDFYDVQDTIMDAGKEPAKYVLMNTTQWRQFIKADEVVDFGGPNVFNQPPRALGPAVNAALSAAGLPQVVVVNTRIRREINDGSTLIRTTTNPWTDNYCTFAPSLQMGNMLYTDPPAKGRETDTTVQSYRNGILVSKWYEKDPITEYTKGESVCFPIIPNIYNLWRFRTSQAQSDGLDN